MSKTGWRSYFTGLVPLFVIAHFGHHVMASLLVPLLPFIRDEFTLDYTQSGWVVSAFTLSYGLSHLPAGWLADRIGQRILITIGISGVALSGLLVGLSPSYTMMVFALILLGITGGGYHPASAPLVSSSVPPEKRGGALGIHQLGGTFSHFLGPLLAATIAGLIGWRGSFITLAVPTFILGIILYTILGRRQNGQNAIAQHQTSQDSSETKPGRWRYIIAFLVLAIIGQTLLFSVISFVSLFLVDEFALSEEVAAGSLALAYGAGLVGGPLGGFLSDRFGRVKVAVFSSLIAGPVILLLNIVPKEMGFATGSIYIGAVHVVIFLIGVSMYLRMPVQESYIIGQTPAKRRSTVLGIYYWGSRGGTGFITPLLGFMIGKIGFYSSFSIIAASMVAITIICGLLLWGSHD